MANTPIDNSRYTLAQAYADICAGMPPWVALNEFQHAWHSEGHNRRVRLISDPVRAPGNAAQDRLWKWAVVCAALAECLCQEDDIEYPAWVNEPAYKLADPWYGFDAPGAANPAVRDYLEQTTPEPFRRRGILSGNRVLANKYAFANQQAPYQLPEGGKGAHRLP